MKKIYDEDAKFPEVATDISGLMNWLQDVFSENGFDSFDALIAAESVAEEWWKNTYSEKQYVIFPSYLREINTAIEVELIEFEQEKLV